MVLAPAAAASPLSVHVDDGEAPESCVAAAPVDGSPCAATWDTGAPDDAGDDRVGLGVDVREARVAALPAASGGHAVAASPGDVRVDHPVFLLANATWSAADGLQPEATRAWLGFESRPNELYYDGAWHPTPEWGVFLMAWTPVPVKGTQWYPLVSLCWENCVLDHNEVIVTDERSVRPFGDTLLLRDFAGRDTDATADDAAADAGRCRYPFDGFAAGCPALASVAHPVGTAVDAAQEATPAFAWGFRLERAQVALGETTEGGPDEGPLMPSDPPSTQAPSPSRAPASRAPDSSVEPTVRAPDTLPGASLAGTLDASAARSFALALGDASGGSATALAAGGLGLALLALLGWALYSRIARAEALDQETRQRVFDAIRADPGIRVGTLAKRLGLSYNSVKYQVRVLEGFRLVVGSGKGQRGWYPAGASVGPGVGIAADAVHGFLRDRLRADYRTLGAELDMAPSTISLAVGRLRDAGLVEMTRNGRRLDVRLATAGPASRT